MRWAASIGLSSSTASTTTLSTGTCLDADALDFVAPTTTGTVTGHGPATASDSDYVARTQPAVVLLSCAVTTSLTVTSDEPVVAPPRDQGLAGLTSPDWEIVDAHHVRLRAERSVKGDGRVYTIRITAADAAGGSATAQLTVTVPR